MSLSVVILAYNEEQNVEAVVREIDSVLATVGQEYELVVVDDGSTDTTGQIVNRLAQEIGEMHVIHHEINLGLGGGYRTGFAAARGDLVTFFPADGQFPATIIREFLPLMDDADMVLGYLPDRSSSLLAKSLSAIEKIVYRALFGPLPRFQGVLMFQRTLLDEFELRSVGRGWAVLMELIIRTCRGGYKVVSVPTEMRPRMSGRSKVNNLRTIWANLKQVVALRRELLEE
ncbi:MAG: glycosyltransferase family 2 protein [Anaerolineae bacterium]|nr:glycosyltransferase family 2 protein [Anaerolineae bacterium]